MKKVKLFEQFITEGKDIFPNEVVGNDQILFKKEWEKMNGGKLAAKYNQYYKGYNIDAGGRIFNSVDQLEKYIKATELSNNQYNKYKYMPEIPIKESNGIDSDIKKLETLIRKQFNVVEFKVPSKRPLNNEEFLMVKVKDDKYGGPQTGLGKFIKRWAGVEASFVDNHGNDKVYWVSLEKIENGPGVHESVVNEGKYDFMSGLSIQFNGTNYSIISVKDDLVNVKDSKNNEKTFRLSAIVAQNPGVDVKPRMPRPSAWNKGMKSDAYSKSEYQKILKDAIKDAGGSEYAHDMAQSMIYDPGIRARIEKDYPMLRNINQMIQRLQWDLEMY